MKTPKSQIPNSKKLSSSKLEGQRKPKAFEFAVWDLELYWSLGLGVWDFFCRVRDSRLPISRSRGESASTFVIVLWIAFGLVSMALYFGNSMSSELRASDNRVSGVAAEQAIDGA